MIDIQTTLLSLLPPKRKQTPSGWTSFNAPCCYNRGESADTRQRGGILLNPEGGFQYHCFNCGFKAGWSKGHLLSKNTKSFFKWIGMPDDLINKFSLELLKNKEDQSENKITLNFDIQEKKLPDSTLPLIDYLKQDLSTKIEQQLLAVVKYLVTDRGMELDWYPWHYSLTPGLTDRIIIPFYFQDKIVGYTARKIVDGKPKYLTDSQPGYVFNLDNQTYDKKFLILVEGQFDAIAIDGAAIMHNEPNDIQCARINALNKEVIVVPDRDKPGAKLIKAALDNNWNVSLPPWDNTIKDVADAVKHYGRLYTLATILHYKESNTLKIQLLKKKLEQTNG